MKTLIPSIFFAVFGIAAPCARPARLWRASGFEQPESALFDAANQRIIVSNIVGNPGKADGNGYLSVLSLDGKIVTRHWTDGMDAPKGMAISGGKLYVADITKVRVVDLASGKLVSSIDVPNAVFLNDVTATLGQGLCHRHAGRYDLPHRRRQTGAVREGCELAAPNGIFADGGRLIVASWGKGIKPDFSTAEPGGLLSVDIASKAITPLPGAQNFADLDGVVAIGGSIYATAYMTGTLYRYTGWRHAGSSSAVSSRAAPTSAPTARRIFPVPLMNEGEIAA